MSEYTPTTDEVIRSFSIPEHRVVERKDGESFADYLSRASIETNELQMESEAAAWRWLAEHDAQMIEKLADEWTRGAWANVPRKADRAADRLAAANYVGDWLREQAQARRKRA